jgi:predicted dehydrogenase
MTARTGIALVGAGAFGEFCLAAFADMPEVTIAAVVDVDVERSKRCAERYNALSCTRLEDALTNAEVEIVALNTPPFLHAEQGLAVLQAGRHLFCEKPLALSTKDGEALASAAQASNCRLTVNYVMRQNPLWALAAALRASSVLGCLLHMDLANHAAGKDLPANHWFWDPQQSGGIWIEHGVHFFDAFAWAAGAAGRVLSAQSSGAAQVECLAVYGDTLAHFYHGFTHSHRTEQTTVQLTFEHAHVTLHDWVPTQMIILTETSLDQLGGLLPATAAVTAYDAHRWQVQVKLGRKSDVYARCIADGMRHFISAIKGQEPLKVSAHEALSSLRMAEEAQFLSHS